MGNLSSDDKVSVLIDALEAILSSTAVQNHLDNEDILGYEKLIEGASFEVADLINAKLD